MSNPHKGEKSFEVDGQTYTLHYSTNAICELEDELDRSFVSIAKDLAQASTDPDKIRMGTLRAIFWAGLQDRHPSIGVEEAGDLMMRAGGMVGAMELISEGFARAFPAPEAKGAGPQETGKTANGIGLVS